MVVNNPEVKGTILIKYGGNAMVNEELKSEIIKKICTLKSSGYHIILVHGGGPFIRETLEMARIESEFIGGHRKTTPEALKYVEMALKGSVNGNLVNLINKNGHKAVGLSGKDGKMVTAIRRYHEEKVGEKATKHDIGQVGDVAKIDITLISILLDNDYIPVVTSLASDTEGADYNINADMFAGQLAGELKVDQYIVLTDVDGLMKDLQDPGSVIKKVTLNGIDELITNNLIRGGMIPKMESCMIAIQKGAAKARIINGMKPGQIIQAVKEKNIGTLITN